MAITTYPELQTAVSNWLHRSGETGLSDRIEEFIDLAEDRINLDLIGKGGIGPMEASEDLTISGQFVATPTRYAGTRRLYISDNPNRTLDYLPPEAFYSKFLSTEAGTPEAFTVEGDQTNTFNLVFGPIPSTSFTGKHLYFQKFEPLSASASNWLLSNARGLLLYGALLEAAAFFDKPPVMLLQWSQMYDSEINLVLQSDRTSKYPAGSLSVQPEGVGIV